MICQADNYNLINSLAELQQKRATVDKHVTGERIQLVQKQKISRVRNSPSAFMWTAKIRHLQQVSQGFK
jgi:hypothetical protein